MQFQHKDYQGFTLGIWRRDENQDNPIFCQSLLQLVNQSPGFPAVDQTVWWPARYCPAHLKNWSHNRTPWLQIESGELCKTIINDAQKFYQLIQHEGLLQHF